MNARGLHDGIGSECSGRMQLITFIAEAKVAKVAKVAKRILDHLALDSTGPPVARVQPHAELLEPGPDYGAANVIGRRSAG
jgi:hypothetical protein